MFIVSFFRRLWRTIQYWNDIDGNLLAAAVSFYASLATFPLIMVLMSAFGYFLKFSGYSEDFQSQVLKYIEDTSSEALAREIGGLLNQIEANAELNGPLGLLFLLMLSMALFVNFERAFAAIWKTKTEPVGIWRNVTRIILHRLRAFLMLVVVALLILTNFLSNMAIEVVANYFGEFWFSQSWWRLVHIVSALTVNTLLFTIINLTLPKVRVHWTRAIQGGMFTAITWELGRYALAWLVISDKYNAFGVVGVFMGLLMWTFYGSAVILMGAVFVRVSRKVAMEREKAERAENNDELQASADQNGDTKSPK